MYSSCILQRGANRFSYSQFVRFVSALKRASVQFDEEVMKNLEENYIKPRKHPGVMPRGPINLPNQVKTAMNIIIEDGARKQLLRESKDFKNYLHSRHLPKEHDTLNGIISSIKTDVEKSMNVKTEDLNEIELKKYEERLNSKVNNLLKKRVYNWKRLDFNRHLSLLYFIARSDAEYASLSHIFNEIDLRTSFQPKSVFDFGSGLGSVIWAADNIWGASISEYYCVDSSDSMIDLSKSILAQYGEKFSRKIFHRQFLPSSNEISSDIVVSAYSLMELPSAATRLETIKNLWDRTNKYLVLIEQGTLAGFTIINEARNFILSKKGSHVFSPCPHDSSCPRIKSHNVCHFVRSYLCYPEKPEQLQKEYFSYVVFKKGNRKTENNWPRIVQPVLRRSRHVICRFCTKDADLKEVIFTANKNGKLAYRCAKASAWGDLFPCQLKNEEKIAIPEEKEIQE